uniref:Uncharacterized protein n=1 Tax=Panagrolaimus sp. JU765 TaxID=591449 RepID=A0AC34RM33_9BILA
MMKSSDDYISNISLGIAFAVYFIRATDLAISIERFIATIYSKNYEKTKKFKIIGPIFLCFCLIFGIFTGLIFGVGDFPFYFKYPCVFAIDVVNITGIQLLMISNRKRRKFRLLQNIGLSQKYQIEENLQVLYLFRIQSILTLCGGSVTYFMIYVRYGLGLSDVPRAVGSVVSLDSILIVFGSDGFYGLQAQRTV